MYIFGLRLQKKEGKISVIHLLENLSHHERSKHIDVRHHFVIDVIAKGDLKSIKVNTSKSSVDMFSESLPRVKFNYFLNLLHINPDKSVGGTKITHVVKFTMSRGRIVEN